MSKDNLNNSRKTSDLLLSLEENVLMLIKSMAVLNMNNKLILDRLNKMLAQEAKPIVKAIEEPKVYSITSSTDMDISQTPLIPRKKTPGLLAQNNYMPDEYENKSNIPSESQTTPIPTPAATKKQAKSNQDKIMTKIPVGQHVTDQNGKDIFMADVAILNTESKEVLKAKTSAIGKWQTYLPIGKYSIKIIKITNPETLDKIEYIHNFEIHNGMKSLLLPAAVMNR